MCARPPRAAALYVFTYSYSLAGNVQGGPCFYPRSLPRLPPHPPFAPIPPTLYGDRVSEGARTCVCVRDGALVCVKGPLPPPTTTHPHYHPPAHASHPCVCLKRGSPPPDHPSHPRPPLSPFRFRTCCKGVVHYDRIEAGQMKTQSLPTEYRSNQRDDQSYLSLLSTHI